MRTIGIDIGTFSIKVAEVTSASKGVALKDYYEIPFSADLTQDPYIQQLDILRKIANHYDSSQTKFVLAIQQQHISVRNKVFPFREKHKINRTLGFELEDDIPFDQQDAVFEAKIRLHRGSSSEVLALACPNMYVEQILTVCNDAGIDPEIISAEGVSLSNLIEGWEQNPQEMAKLDTTSGVTLPEEKEASLKTHAQAILHIGHKHTLVIAVVEKTIISIRNIDYGGASLANTVARKYNLSYPEALKLVQERAFVLTDHKGVTPDQIAFSDIISDGLQELVSQVRLCLLEMSCDHHLQFENLYLSGGVALLMNICPFFTQHLEISTNLFRHLHLYGQVNMATTDKMELTSCLAIALAIEAHRKPKNPAINFRKNQFARENQSTKMMLQKWKHAAQIAVAILLVFYVHSFFRENFSAKLAESSKETLKKQALQIGLKKNETSVSKIKNFIRTEKLEVQAKKDLAKMVDLNSALDLLRKISEKSPGKDQITLDVRRFYVNNEVLTLEGFVTQPIELEKLKTALKGASQDQALEDLKPTLQVPQGKTPFAYSIKMARHSSASGGKLQ